MITKTLNLDSAYAELFDEIREKSNGAIDINNVEGFFGNILEISALDKKYLRLPLDEPLFAIDANSRKITVPDEFRSNGLSVQGDHLAETVYFVIDRYFDYMDLNNTDVSINWKMGNETGKTDRFTMSTDVIPGSIVFGWPVNNIITKKSGVLTFAVEFCRKDNQGNVLYDFNTLTASINIKEGLVVGDIEVVNLDNDILAALTNSQFGEGDAAVGAIQWLTGAGRGLVAGSGADSAVILSDYAAEVNLRTNVVGGVPESVPANLYAEAFVDNGTEVKYMDSVGNNITPIFSMANKELVEADGTDESLVYRDAEGEIVDPASADTVYLYAPLDERLVYYVKLDENAYRIATAEEMAAWNTSAQVDLYIELAKIVASEAGSYVIKAQGQKFDNEGRKIGAGVATSSEVVTVPTVKTPSAIAIEKSAAPVVDDENYSFDEEASANVVFLGESGASLTASAVVEDFGALQFVWQKKIGEETSFSNVEAEDPAYVTNNESVLQVSEAGEYKVSVKNFKNGGYASEVASDIVLASPLAGKITSAKAYRAVGNGDFAEVSGLIRYNSSAGQQKGKVTLKIDDIVIDGAQGDIEYEWYIESGSDEDVVLTYVASGNNYVIQGGDGSFVPVIKNNYNGSIYTYRLNTINIDDDSNN